MVITCASRNDTLTKSNISVSHIDPLKLLSCIHKNEFYIKSVNITKYYLKTIKEDSWPFIHICLNNKYYTHIENHN